MPAAYPKEFRDDVVAVARQGEMPIEQVAKDFGITESCLRRWLARDDVEAGVRPGVTQAESEELRKAKRRVRELEMENEVLRRAAAYLSPSESEAGPSPKMRYPVVSDLAVDGIPVKLSCRVRGFSRQAYYQSLADPVSEREWSDAHAANAVLDAHLDDPEFGYRFLADELR